MTVTGTTRELACLTLGHEDAGEPRCLTSDEQLVAELVEEVQRLRVAAGVVEESETDRSERVEAVEDVLLDVVVDPLEAREAAEHLVAALDEAGWTLHPIRRP